jgi:hypothetical protein
VPHHVGEAHQRAPEAGRRPAPRHQRASIVGQVPDLP